VSSFWSDILLNVFRLDSARQFAVLMNFIINTAISFFFNVIIKSK